MAQDDNKTNLNSFDSRYNEEVYYGVGSVLGTTPAPSVTPTIMSMTDMTRSVSMMSNVSFDCLSISGLTGINDTILGTSSNYSNNNSSSNVGICGNNINNNHNLNIINSGKNINSVLSTNAIYDSFDHGMMFMCKNGTYEECMKLQLFGVGEKYIHQVMSLNPKTCALFLYNVTEKELYGIFMANGKPGFNIVPHAWNINPNSKNNRISPFPSQIPIKLDY